MEREILFRAKRLDSGEWAEGCLLADYVTGQYFIHAVGNSVNESGRTNEEGCLKFFAHGADPETVCRYTGMADRNGRKIFEGDIVKCIEKRGAAFRHCKVVWNDEWARFDVTVMECSFPMCLDTCVSDIPISGSDYEVIGNMFDNPELKEEETW